jgi:hypothetical protein
LVNRSRTENIRACSPRATAPVVSPTRSSRSLITTLPPSTPIDPVIVADWATITSAGHAT